MADTWIVDIRHYFDAGGTLPPQVRPLALHFGRIVAAATARPAGATFESAVPCRRRPRRRACPGRIVVQRSQVPPRIRWECPRCEDRGLIEGFEESPWDLSRVPPDEEQERATVVFPEREYRALVEIDVLGLDCEALLSRGRPLSEGVEIEGSRSLLDHLQGLVAAAANHEERAGRQRLLDGAYQRIEAELHVRDSGAGLSDEEFDAFLRKLLAHAPESIRQRKRNQKSKTGRSAARGKKGSRMRATPRTVHRLRIELLEVRPSVWRRVEVPSEITLAGLHDVIQTAVGWTDSHLHRFEIHGRHFGVPSPEDWEPVHDERKVRLVEVLPAPKERALYNYDFGDDWWHDVMVEEIATAEPGTTYPICIAGRRACSPEDVGGPGGYARMLEVLANHDDPEREEFLVWLGGAFDADAFDLEAVNRALRGRA